MQTAPHDEGWRWLFALCVPLFAGGVAWLVKHLMGRGTTVVQLGLQTAQTDEIRARIRRDDESAALAALKEVAGELRADVGRLRDDRDYWQKRAEKAERYLLEREIELPPRPDDGKS